jgi:hypothetical protein
MDHLNLQAISSLAFLETAVPWLLRARHQYSPVSSSFRFFSTLGNREYRALLMYIHLESDGNKTV